MERALLMVGMTAPPLPLARRRDEPPLLAYARRMRVPKMRAAKAVVYPESDDMGENALHRLIAELFRPLLERFFAERQIVANVGANQFIYWARGCPTKRIAPDVYVLPGVDPKLAIASWKTWEHRATPSFVLEIASDNWNKDYEDNPVLYDELGVKELVIFDPQAKPGARSRRVRWQVYRRVHRRGLVRVLVSQSDRVRSKHLGAWLRTVGVGDEVRVRLALDPDGEELYFTETEAERAAKEQALAAKEHERAAKEQALAAKEHERAAKEQALAAKEHERAARLRAEADVARLRALLAEKVGGQRRRRTKASR